MSDTRRNTIRLPDLRDDHPSKAKSEKHLARDRNFRSRHAPKKSKSTLTYNHEQAVRKQPRLNKEELKDRIEYRDTKDRIQDALERKPE